MNRYVSGLSEHPTVFSRLALIISDPMLFQTFFVYHYFLSFSSHPGAIFCSLVIREEIIAGTNKSSLKPCPSSPLSFSMSVVPGFLGYRNLCVVVKMFLRRTQREELKKNKTECRALGNMAKELRLKASTAPQAGAIITLGKWVLRPQLWPSITLAKWGCDVCTSSPPSVLWLSRSRQVYCGRRLHGGRPDFFVERSPTRRHLWLK